MIKNIASLLVLAFALTGSYVSAQTVVPVEFDRLRTSYESARERAVRPIDEKYLTELTKLQDTYTKAAKLEDAVLVANEIKRMKERLGEPVAPGGPALVAPTTPAAALGGSGQEVTVNIVPNDPNGYRLGGVKRGDTITLQYVSGKWKGKGTIASENPDDPKASYGEDDRLVIAEAADANGNEGKVIKVVPPETATTPFVYVMQTSRNDVVLRINVGSQRKQNPGYVSYKMKLVR